MKVHQAPLQPCATVAVESSCQNRASAPVGAQPSLTLPPAPRAGGAAKPTSAGGSGFSAGALYQHALKGHLDLPRAMSAAMEAARGSADPATKEKAIALAETFLLSRGVRTSRTAENDLRIEPDSKTAYGRYALFAAKNCGVQVVVDPTDTAGASFSRHESKIRISCDNLPDAKPGFNDLHEMVHACFASAPAAERHPLSGKCYRATPDIPILGYEKGYSRDEMMTYAMQAQLTLGVQADALAEKIAQGAGDKSALRALFEDWETNPALAYCRAFAVDSYLSALDLAESTRVLMASGPIAKPGFVLSKHDSSSVSATVEDGSSWLSATDERSGKRMWFNDRSLRADCPPAELASRFIAAASATKALCDAQVSAVDQCQATQAKMVALLERSREARLSSVERTELLALLQQFSADLRAVRNVTLPPNTPLLPKGFELLEAEALGKPLYN